MGKLLQDNQHEKIFKRSKLVNEKKDTNDILEKMEIGQNVIQKFTKVRYQQKKGMGIGKNVFDVTCFCMSGIIGLVFTRYIIGLGIGTVLAVIFTGRVIAVYNYFLKYPMQNLAGITAEL